MRTEPGVPRAIARYCYSLLFFKSDHKALALAEDCLYLVLIFCQSLISVVSESGNTKKVLIPHNNSAYGIDQMSKRCYYFTKF